MAKIHTDEKGNRYVRHKDVLAEDMKDPAFREAYMQRRYVHEIALAVRSMREGAGLSQADLAAMVGTKQPAIARLETSQHQAPQWGTLNRIALVLHKQLDLRLGAVEDGKPLVRVINRPVRGGVAASR
jgi:ribosome-binding protein aMBF1 (putative translation factor)